MSKITLALLKAVAPSTRQDLLDRFIPHMNAILPEYGIVSELQVSAFLATAAFESQYFQKTKEGHARVGTKARGYQDKYWGTGFMGRGIFQTTHRRNYLIFGQKMLQLGKVDNANLFVEHPELLEQSRWAVESACQYWQTNKLDKWALRGTKGFFGLQGLVNRGSAEKEALDYDSRLAVYEKARRAMPDDFKLDSAVSPNEPTPHISAPDQAQGETSNKTADKPLLKMGSKGDAVCEVQKILGVTVDGDFGKDTEAAVINFQIAHHLDADGKVGPETWSALKQNPTPGDSSGQGSSDGTNETKVEVTGGDVKVETNQPAFVSEEKEMQAPVKDGAEAKAVGGTILGIVVPGFVYTLFKGVQEWIEKGFIDGKELVNGIVSFISGNTKFIFILIGLIIAVIIVKKVFKQITFIVQMIINANPALHNVTVTPAPVEKKAWWKFW